MPRVIGYGGNVFVGDQIVEDCEDAWDEQAIANVTPTADTTDLRVGNASAKFACAAIFALGIVGTEVVVLPTLAAYTVLYGWVKSSVNTTAIDDYRILIDNHALCASPDCECSLPILTANVWKFCIMPVVAGSFAAANLPISVGLELMANDPGLCDVWLDHIVAAREVAGIRSWSLDQVANVQDVSAYSDGQDKVFIVTQKEWSGSFEGFKNQAPLNVGLHVGLELFEAEPAWPIVPTQSWRGMAVITNCRPSSTVDGVVQYAYDFQGIYNLEVPTA